MLGGRNCHARAAAKTTGRGGETLLSILETCAKSLESNKPVSRPRDSLLGFPQPFFCCFCARLLPFGYSIHPSIRLHIQLSIYLSCKARSWQATLFLESLASLDSLIIDIERCRCLSHQLTSVLQPFRSSPLSSTRGSGLGRRIRDE